MATWWYISGDDTAHMGNIWKDVVTKWRHGRREAAVTWILLYQQKVTTVLYLHWHIYVVHIWLHAHCAAPMSTRLNEQTSSACRHEEALRACVWLCVTGVEQWPLLAGRGASQTESLRFRRADVPHSSNSQCQGHRRDSHTVDEGWLSRGCNPTLHCASPSLCSPTHTVFMRYSLSNTGILIWSQNWQFNREFKNLVIQCKWKLLPKNTIYIVISLGCLF